MASLKARKKGVPIEGDEAGGGNSVLDISAMSERGSVQGLPKFDLKRVERQPDKSRYVIQCVCMYLGCVDSRVRVRIAYAYCITRVIYMYACMKMRMYVYISIHE
jgi:hypothetical protein